LGKEINTFSSELETDASQFLIPLAQRGDQQAMRQLYDQYSKAMLNTAYRILNNREDAEDALQESFIKAFKNLHRFKHESTFGAWIKRIVVNGSINQLRKKQRLIFYDTPPEPKEEFTEISFCQDNEKKLEILYKSLSSLPDGYRTVFSLYALEGYDHQEISQILDIKVSTSISQLSRAKQKLKSIIIQTQNRG